MFYRNVLLTLCIVTVPVLTGATSYAQELDQRLSLGAELRYRHEMMDVEDRDMRNRELIRARLFIDAELDEHLSIGFTLISGSDDPVAANQNLTGGFSTKQLNIDQAFFDWDPDIVENLSLTGGKMPNPFYLPGRTELVWDTDLRPEGLCLSYRYTRGMMTLNLATSYLLVEERASDNDAFLFGNQARVSGAFPVASVLLGLGYYDYENTRGYAPFWDATDGLGNTLTAGNTYRYDYNELELFSEVSFSGLPFHQALFFNYVTNLAEHVSENRGWLAGFTVGRCSTPGTKSFRYIYRELEKDAVIGRFTDSIFIDGGTDGRGHELNIEYQIAQVSRLCISYLPNQIGIENGKDFHRVMIDFYFTY